MSFSEKARKYGIKALNKTRSKASQARSRFTSVWGYAQAVKNKPSEVVSFLRGTGGFQADQICTETRAELKLDLDRRLRISRPKRLFWL